MSITASSNALTELAARLTDAQDRQTYAALISFLNSLPETDELFHLAQLLGLLSLLGQRIPDALAEFLAEFRAQTASSARYHAALEQRLARLPEDIGARVDAAAIARAMSESFRQQLAATGLQETAILLHGTVNEIQGLSGQIAAALKPVPQQYKGIGATISSELARLQTASSQLQEHNGRLRMQERRNAWVGQGLLALVLFFLGVFSGLLLEKRQTTEVLSDIDTQIQGIQWAVASKGAVLPKENRRRRNVGEQGRPSPAPAEP